MKRTASKALKVIPQSLKSEPVFLCVDDTMVAKFGKKFEKVSTLFDHAAHNGSNYLNGHCFVSLMLCIPVWHKHNIMYRAIPLGYRMWEKTDTKLTIAADMIKQVMPLFSDCRQIILECDSWYAKHDFLSIIEAYDNLDVICNARHDSAIYAMPPARTGKRGRPAKRGRKLSATHDFVLSDKKIGDYYIGSQKVMTRIFGDRPVCAYVTTPDKNSDSRRIFFSSIFPECLQMLCAKQEHPAIRESGERQPLYLPMILYCLRWNIETSYYEQKTFWSLCSYMIRSQKGIEFMVNIINVAYCAMKILPFADEEFYQYQDSSVQEFRYALGARIREQVFIRSFVDFIESGKKTSGIIGLLKQWVSSVSKRA